MPCDPDACPRVSFSRILDEAARLASPIAHFADGKRLDGLCLEAAEAELSDGDGIGRRAARSVLEPFAGLQFGDAELRLLGCRIRQFLPVLRKDEAVPAWYGDPPFWGCFEVRSAARGRETRKIVLEVLYFSGLLAGSRVLYPLDGLTARRCMEKLGFPRYGDSGASDMTGMRGIARTGRDAQNGISLLKMHVNTEARKHNLGLRRARQDKMCKLFAGPCFLCKITSDICPLSCRAKPWGDRQMQLQLTTTNRGEDVSGS